LEALALFLAIFAYFLPASIAFARGHHQKWAITILNVLLGMTGLGWVAALIWSATAVQRRPEPDRL
jgi:hypothetical protein